MKDPKPIADKLLSSRPPGANALGEARERARAYVASTLIELGRGSAGDPTDVQLAELWANELVEAIADYAALKAETRRADSSPGGDAEGSQ